MNAGGARRRLYAPEIIQTSSMDCGPAALKSLLAGYNIPISYGRLREACQTDIDGTSIDTLEEIACQAGLDAEQVLVPSDHVLLNRAQCLPCIAAVRGAAGDTHFIVIWRTHGPLIQIMDPARGRLWLRRSTLIDQLVLHSMTVRSENWRAWATSSDALEPLRARLAHIGVSPSQQATLIDEASHADGCQALATLDAATRMLRSLRDAGAVPAHLCYSALTQLIELSSRGPDPITVIPETYWSARIDAADPAHVAIRGAVLTRVKGRRSDAHADLHAISPELAAAFAEPPTSPLRDVGRLVRAGARTPILLMAALTISVFGVVLEALLLRSTVDLRQMVQGPGQALWAGAALVAFAVLLLGLEWFCAATERRLGNHLEARLRMAFLDKLPRLSDAYFLSRPVADMLERSHSLHTLRTLPRLAARFSRVTLELLVTAGALVWLNPATAWLVALACGAAALIPLIGQSLVAERDLRARTHTGALAKFHLDALRGRTAVEAHGAAAAIEREHELKLADWATSARALQRTSLAVEGVQMTIGFALAAWMLLGHAGAHGGAPLLLQAYWMLSLPGLGYEMALIAREYPALRTTILRILEPLGAPDVSRSQRNCPDASPTAIGATLSFQNASVRVAGHVVLDNITLDIKAGEHVAIVGTSGAGKSTLVSLLLGWGRTASGALLVDGVELDEAQLVVLRQATAWVDPTVQLWNRPLLENLLYSSTADADSLGSVLEGAGLMPVVARLPNGLATVLGESGALLSGGEAQRVRFARALLTKTPRLAVLDEPFVGLERDRRRSLLAYARQRWAQTTLLYVTHDVPETRGFDRVLVLDRGRLVEDGDPRQLANSASSRYRRLLLAHETTQNRLLNGDWRRIRIDGGRIVQDRARSNDQTA